MKTRFTTIILMAGYSSTAQTAKIGAQVESQLKFDGIMSEFEDFEDWIENAYDIFGIWINNTADGFNDWTGNYFHNFGDWAGDFVVSAWDKIAGVES